MNEKTKLITPDNHKKVLASKFFYSDELPQFVFAFGYKAFKMLLKEHLTAWSKFEHFIPDIMKDNIPYTIIIEDGIFIFSSKEKLNGRETNYIIEVFYNKDKDYNTITLSPKTKTQNGNPVVLTSLIPGTNKY